MCRTRAICGKWYSNVRKKKETQTKDTHATETEKNTRKNNKVARRIPNIVQFSHTFIRNNGCLEYTAEYFFLFFYDFLKLIFVRVFFENYWNAWHLWYVAVCATSAHFVWPERQQSSTSHTNITNAKSMSRNATRKSVVGLAITRIIWIAVGSESTHYFQFYCWLNIFYSVFAVVARFHAVELLFSKANDEYSKGWLVYGGRYEQKKKYAETFLTFVLYCIDFANNIWLSNTFVIVSECGLCVSLLDCLKKSIICICWAVYSVEIWLSHCMMSHWANSSYRLIKHNVVFLHISTVSSELFSFVISIELKTSSIVNPLRGFQLDVRLRTDDVKMKLEWSKLSYRFLFSISISRKREKQNYSPKQYFKTGQRLKTVGVGHRRTETRDAYIFGI